MNIVDIILIIVIAIAFIAATRYSMTHASCEACDGQSCGVGHGKHKHAHAAGGGCQHCNYKEIEEQEIPERFKLKK